jgi:hypothetical protein
MAITNRDMAGRVHRYGKRRAMRSWPLLLSMQLSRPHRSGRSTGALLLSREDRDRAMPRRLRGGGKSATVLP